MALRKLLKLRDTLFHPAWARQRIHSIDLIAYSSRFEITAVLAAMQEFAQVSANSPICDDELHTQRTRQSQHASGPCLRPDDIHSMMPTELRPGSTEGLHGNYRALPGLVPKER